MGMSLPHGAMKRGESSLSTDNDGFLLFPVVETYRVNAGNNKCIEYY